MNTDFPVRFINSNINNFVNNIDQDEEIDYIIPPNFFEIKKPFLLIELPYCEQNEKYSKRFLSKFHQFTNNQYDVAIRWITKKVKQLFKLKDRNPHPSCVIYEGVCSCGTSYIGETKRNVEVRWSEHNDIRKDSEPAKHLKDNINHFFTWNILMPASIKTRLRKNLEASIIAFKRPHLNEQLEFKKLMLFRNGVT